jgi:hypothetical protein
MEPVLRIVRGEPDDAEVAALTAVVLGLAASTGPGAAEPEAAERGGWADRSALVRRPMPQPGPGAWRASGLPR